MIIGMPINKNDINKEYSIKDILEFDYKKMKENLEFVKEFKKKAESEKEASKLKE
jgi:hypothetical protein